MLLTSLIPVLKVALNVEVKYLFFHPDWIEKGKMEEREEKEEKEEPSTAYEIFLKYTEDSTIQGLIYIFFPYQVSISSTFYVQLLRS